MNITITPQAGDKFQDVVLEAMKLSRKHSVTLTWTNTGRTLEFTKNTTVREVYELLTIGGLIWTLKT